jgi:hypothetical protein
MPDKDKTILADEHGFVLVGALLILLLLVLIGVAATTSTTLELQMAASHRARALAFYGAESGQSFARGSQELYGSANVVVDEGLDFPSSPTPLGANADQSFTGSVTYQGSGVLPRGSGFSDDYNAHFYNIESTGRGPNNAETTVAVGAYRVGF